MSYDIKEFKTDLLKISNGNIIIAILLLFVVLLLCLIWRNRNVIFSYCKDEKNKKNDIYKSCRALINKYMKTLFTEQEPDFDEEYNDLVSEIELHYDSFFADNFAQLKNYICQTGATYVGDESNPEAKELCKELANYSQHFFEAMQGNKIKFHKKEISKIQKRINNILYNW